MESNLENMSIPSSTTQDQLNLRTIITEVKSEDNNDQPEITSNSLLTELIQQVNQDKLDGDTKSFFKIESLNNIVSYTSAVKTTVREIRTTTHSGTGEKTVSINEEKTFATKSGFGERILDLTNANAEGEFRSSKQSELYKVSSNQLIPDEGQLKSEMMEVNKGIEQLTPTAAVEEEPIIRQRHIPDSTQSQATCFDTASRKTENSKDSLFEVPNMVIEKKDDSFIDVRFVSRFVGFFCLFLIVFWILN